MLKSRLLLALSVGALSASATASGNGQVPARVAQLILMNAAEPALRQGDPELHLEGEAGSAQPDYQFRLLQLERRWMASPSRLAAASAEGSHTGIPIRGNRKTDAFNPPVSLSPGDDNGHSLRAITLRPTVIPSWMQPNASVLSSIDGFEPGCGFQPYRPSGFLGQRAELRRQALYDAVSLVACEAGLPVGLFDAMIIRESRYDPASVSPKQAFGLTQLMPATAVALGIDRFDVMQNLRGGARYLRRQLDRFGQYHLALAAYNAGPGRVNGTVPAIAETRAYVGAILRDWVRLSGINRSNTVQPTNLPTTSARTRGGRNVAVLTF